MEDDFQLICFDIVSEPSTPNAYVYPKDKSELDTTLRTRMQENKQNNIEDLFNKILKG